MFEIFGGDSVSEAADEESFVGVALHLGVFARLVLLDALGEQFLLLLLFLELLAVALLQPAVRGHVAVVVLVLAHGLEVLGDAANLGRAARLRRMVNWLNPAQRRARSEQVQKHWGELVRHLG